MTLTFVSSYYNIYDSDDQDFQFRLAQFIVLAQSGIHMVLFTNEVCAELIGQELCKLKEHNVKISIVDLIFPEEDLQKKLPKFSKPSKDTPKFLMLMQKKIEFMAKAIELNVWPMDTHFAWVDFSLAKIFEDVDKCVNALKKIDNTPLPHATSIVLPGCWIQRRIWDLSTYHDCINWRFCGGFFLGDRNACIEFYKLYQTYYAEFSKNNLTWEVNFWAWLEEHGLFYPTWYEADHNDSMVTKFPLI